MGGRCAWRVLATLGRDADIVARAEALPAEGALSLMHTDFARATWLAGADAALRAGMAPRARALAARAIWASVPGPDELRRARRVVIDSYFLERQPEPGYLAMLRYRQDLPGADPATTAQFVRLLLEHDRGRDALPWLPELDAAHPVRLAVQLRLDLMPPAEAAAQARAQLARDGATQWLAVLRGIGLSAGDTLLATAASERLLDQPVPPPGPLASGQLWRDYEAAAAGLANREQLLVGDDAGWAAAAARLAGRDPVAARVLFARLAVQGRTEPVRADARLQLARLLRDSGLGLAAVRLFDEPARFTAAPLAPDLRRLLGELAAARAQPALAVGYWRGLPPGAGQDADAWRLAQADLQARSGRIDEAVQAVAALFQPGRSLPTPALVARTLVLAELVDDAGDGSAARTMRAALRGALEGKATFTAPR